MLLYGQEESPRSVLPFTISYGGILRYLLLARKHKLFDTITSDLVIKCFLLPTNDLNLKLYLHRCQYLSAVLHVPQAAGRPGVQDSRSVALIVCLVQMDRSATTLVVTYSFIYCKVYTLNKIFLPGKPLMCLQRFHRVPQLSGVLLARQRQGEMFAWG